MYLILTDTAGNTGRNPQSHLPLHRAIPLLLALLLLLAQSSTEAAGTILFNGTGELAASAEQLDGRVTLTLIADEPVYDVQVSARGQGPKLAIGQVEYWVPGERHSFDLHMPSPHGAPGDYHLLIEVAFRDHAGGNQGVATALGYRFGGEEDINSGSVSAGALPKVSLKQDRVTWRLPDNLLPQVRLTLTTEPSWTLPDPLTPAIGQVDLEETGKHHAIPNWRYGQLARLEWVKDDRHFSRITDWTLETDAEGKWLEQSTDRPSALWGIRPFWLWTMVGLIALGTLTRRSLAKHLAARGWLPPGRDEWIGGLTLIALTAWAISHATPSLWLTHTWSTGGDVASQVFYAKVFMEWLPTGKISGWLPESFAGFPAFTYYFPFPFILAGLLQFLVGQQVAFKLVSMLPAFLLPAATYASGWMWGWRVPLRLLAAAGATGFIFGGANSIWGGNVLSQLAGEFSYSWGFFFAVLFWGTLSLALRNGGRWWLLSGVLEALVALSHGYALLVVGFGSFVYLLVSRQFWYHLRVILQVHLLAFLLIGFWLMPLLENLPWTIPNDSATAIDSWKTLWPTSLWPLALGWAPLLLLAWRARGFPEGLAFLIGICVLGLLGFVAGGRLGLADLRFFPYSQWALAAASGAAMGWALQRWLPAAALPLAIALVFALGAWWQPRLDTIEGWSRWNLAGYEGKSMWPDYLATAQVNAGPLDDPRLAFEHDPANNDLGSTRTLEALPMFGSRPTLEGLYMESAITGPFIYQLQAEISERPSSPLSRYPSSARSIDDAVGHLNELYANRLLLRSPQKKALFGADQRFRLIAEHGPLQTYELRELKTHLVETVNVPLVASTRKDWLSHAFRRYLLDFPYRERQVYLAKGEGLPAHTAAKKKARVEILAFSRERLVFQTDQPGQPHLIRMSYHPRWSSIGGEPIYLTDPSFMLIYPQSSTVDLVYGWTWWYWLGVAFSLSGFVLFTTSIPRRSFLNPPAVRCAPAPYRRAFSGFLAVFGFLILAAWWNDPERVYQRGHLLFKQGEREGAAALFDRAFDGRRNPGSRAEALFWAARSLQLAGEHEEARKRYAMLTYSFPESYWYPESVYRLIEIHRLWGNWKIAEGLYANLVATVPENVWTNKAKAIVVSRMVPQN